MKRASICLITSLFLLAACNGRDSGIHDGQGPPPPTGFSITPANGLQVAQVAFQSVSTSGEIAGFADSAAPSANAGGGFEKPTTRIASKLGQIVQSIPIDPTVLDCAQGTVTFSAEINDLIMFASGVLSPGDSFLMVYENCDDGAGEVLDGTVDFIVDAFTGNILVGGYDMTMTMNLTDLQSTTADGVLLANGDGTATLNTLVALYVEASVTGNLMTTDTGSSSETLSNYSSAQTLDLNPDPAEYTIFASGTLDSSQLAGTVNYSTVDMFIGFNVDYPHDGELFVSATDSSVRLFADSNVDVHIDVYSNATGTGEPDDTIVTTWAELASL